MEILFELNDESLLGLEMGRGESLEGREHVIELVIATEGDGSCLPGKLALEVPVHGSS